MFDLYRETCEESIPAGFEEEDETAGGEPVESEGQPDLDPEIPF